MSNSDQNLVLHTFDHGTHDHNHNHDDHDDEHEHEHEHDGDHEHEHEHEHDGDHDDDLIGSGTASATQGELSVNNTTGKPSYDYVTGGQFIARDLRKWDGGELGTAGTVTYSFLTTAQAGGNYYQMSASQIAAAQTALSAWADIANITFTWADEATGGFSDSGEIKFRAYDGNGGGVTSYSWYNTTPTKTHVSATVSNTTDSLSLALHEIGHAIGLSHPGNYNGAGHSYADATFYEDTDMYSVMSYWNASNTGGDYFNYYNGVWMGGATGLGLYDISAIQYLYGANTTTYSGNTTYGFGSNTGDAGWTLTSDTDWIQAAIWDTGGIDTIDASGYSLAANIDLREEAFSSLGGLTYNLAIAKGVVIENAVGGSGDDTMRGNSANNTLSGNSGTDTVVFTGNFADYTVSQINANSFSFVDAQGAARDGTDTLNDIESFQFADGTKTKQEIIDSLGSTGDINGTNNGETLSGTSGDDTINGLGGNDLIYGLDGNDIMDAGAGTSWQYLYGGNGDDTYNYAKEDGLVFIDVRHEGASHGAADKVVFQDLNFADITASSIDYGANANGNALRLMWNDGSQSGEIRIGQSGQFIETYEFADGSTMTWQDFLNPTINGTANGETLVGTSGNNTINGLGGNDVIYGQAGNDILDAGAGTSWQYLYGGTGDDTYNYAKEDGLVFVDVRYEGASHGAADKVVFQDLNFADITVSSIDYGSNANGNALRLMWNDGGQSGEIRIGQNGQFIETFQFADGSTMTWQDFLNPTINGTANGETLVGTAGNNTINGLGGNDLIYGLDGDDTLDAGAGTSWQYLYGGNGDDTYNYAKEDGLVFVDVRYEGASHGTADKVVFQDLNFADLTVSSIDYGSNINGNALRLIWNDGSQSGEIRIGQNGQFIETFQFADGSTMTWDQLSSGGSGSSSFTGTNGNDTFTNTVGTNETVDMMDGFDQAIYAGNISDYTYNFSNHDGTITNNATGEIDTFNDVEYIVFDDVSIWV